MTKGVRISKCLKLIPNTSSSGIALRNISAQKYATAFSVANRTDENGGWNQKQNTHTHTRCFNIKFRLRGRFLYLILLYGKLRARRTLVRDLVVKIDRFLDTYLTIGSNLPLKVVHKVRMLVGIANVGRNPVDVAKPSETEVSAESTEIYKSLRVPFQVYVMRSNETTDHPQHVGPKYRLFPLRRPRSVLLLGMFTVSQLHFRFIRSFHLRVTLRVRRITHFFSVRDFSHDWYVRVSSETVESCSWTHVDEQASTTGF